MPVALRNDRPMRFEEFDAFLAGRPDEERWELIDGVAVMNPTPVRRHQQIVGNLVCELERHRRRLAASWSVLPGLGVPISAERAVIPDAVVVPPGSGGSSWERCPIAACEVLSPSTRRTDLAWKPAAYREVASLRVLVLVDPDQRWVRVYERAAGWDGPILERLTDTAPLDALGVGLTLSEIYDGLGA